ncbi:class I SAM-dependent methyltransferase [Cellulomonas denverensis]|uniref:Class I SAM-dependent methyltransferase n=1 Tax=Cellulomonas denverensis TaxID=264297 RepID=A0A7X6R064_9CELL|nr:methyltransferase [Cellulomonas denverensis]NKY23816.1 class I SAM-dependent methyltransferase [Cellulomonas denverensis]GIG25176.1 16S RNA G1207 methylase RsmC [Cellulomonas denverensis]
MSDHYFTAEPASPDQRRDRTVRLRGEEVTVQTAGGVFSPDHLDAGTEVLLREVPEPPVEGDLLDLGCGWGPITLAMAAASPLARVWAVDVNERALDLTRRNAELAGAVRVHAVRPEDVPEDVRFAAIWSNPPIRVGKEVLHAMLRQWLHRLLPGGEAHLVVAKHLGSDSLLRWLDTELGAEFSAERAATAKGFRVLRVVRAG